MDRRGFLGALGALVAAPVLVKAVPPPVAQPGTHVPMAGGRYNADQPLVRRQNCVYQYVQSPKALRAGDVLCFEEGGPVEGYAIGNIDKGHFGWIMVSGGPVPVRIR